MSLHTITDVARLVGKGVSTLKRWEAEGHIPLPSRRDPKMGTRLYTEDEVAAIMKFRDTVRCRVCKYEQSCKACKAALSG